MASRWPRWCCFQLTDQEMGRIAALDTGAWLFFDHRDSEMVSQIGNTRRTSSA